MSHSGRPDPSRNRRRSGSASRSLEPALPIVTPRAIRRLPRHTRVSFLAYRSQEIPSSSEADGETGGEDESDAEGGLSDVEHAITSEDAISVSPGRHGAADQIDSSLFSGLDPGDEDDETTDVVAEDAVAVVSKARLYFQNVSLNCSEMSVLVPMCPTDP